MPGKFYIRTFGCQMNEHDSERIAANLGADGMERTGELEEADVVVLNTCCIRENADNKLYGHLGHLKPLRERRPELRIAVAGCLAQKDRELIVERAPYVDVVFGTHNVHRAAELVARSKVERGEDGRSGRPIVEILDEASGYDEGLFPNAMPVRPEWAHAAWVTIQVGCDNSCAFCIVPAVRGPEMSRPFGEIVDEVAVLVASGVVEVTLLGQNVNSYGRDLTTRLRSADDHRAARHLAGAEWVEGGARRPRPLFADLLRAIGSIDGIRRVRFTSPHPKDLRPETIAAMGETRAVCEHLHLPLQAGSDRTLTAMHRGYSAERYLERLADARRAIPDLAVTTDIIVGFPGETDDDFERTLAVVSEVEYDSAYTFIFSPRPGTRAAAMVDQFVPADVVAERFGRLQVVVERSSLAKHRARIGRVEEVVVEGPSKRDSSVLTGRTRQNKLVHFAQRSEENCHGAGPLAAGQFASVLIESAGAHHLSGRLLAVEERPGGGGQPSTAVRRRLPVAISVR